MDDEDTLALVQTVQEEEIATLILFELVLSAPLSYRDRLLVPDFRLDILAMPAKKPMTNCSSSSATYRNWFSI
ncbi:hypothetical protein PR003_g22506 [Phytophthora rubi]|uniref:Uncharacterized protein n=1 Tax=Phytophthora rubi TaxID=129364 RepID=A0A6A4D7V3_9STRA|nr:hypothetical protein PR003_g22506 [Phytophthora rubi]